MPVLPEEITNHSFRRRWRGYDPDRVDGFLARVGADYVGAIDQVATVAHDGARARSERDELTGRLDALTRDVREVGEQVRADADADAATIRARAERAAELVLAQAEDAAAACGRQAQALRAAAQADADAARQRLEDADQRARQLEDAARDRWDAVRAQTEARFEQLQIAERRFADRARQVETALAGLRTQVGLLEQVQRAEQLLASVRTGDTDSADTDHA